MINQPETKSILTATQWDAATCVTEQNFHDVLSDEIFGPGLAEYYDGQTVCDLSEEDSILFNMYAQAIRMRKFKSECMRFDQLIQRFSNIFTDHMKIMTAMVMRQTEELDAILQHLREVAQKESADKKLDLQRLRQKLDSVNSANAEVRNSKSEIAVRLSLKYSEDYKTIADRASQISSVYTVLSDQLNQIDRIDARALPVIDAMQRLSSESNIFDQILEVGTHREALDIRKTQAATSAKRARGDKLRDLVKIEADKLAKKKPPVRSRKQAAALIAEKIARSPTHVTTVLKKLRLFGREKK